MLKIGDALLTIGVDMSDFNKGMKSMGDKLTSTGKTLSMKVTAPLLAIGVASFKMAGDFDTAFRKVNVMLKASTGESERYKKEILAISSATGKSAIDVTDAFYQIVSAGYRGADAIDILTTAMEGATGGAADTIETTAALTKAMNIFQLEGVEGSNKAMDTFFGIVDSGLLTFEELSRSFPRAASNAAAMGISIEETGATFATLTKVMGSTEQAATATDAIFRALISPSVALEKLYKEWGVRTGPEAIEKFGSLEAVYKKLMDATNGNVVAIKELFNSDEAMKGIIPLLTSSNDDYSASLITITDSTGRTGEAMDEMTQGPGFLWQKMMNDLKNASIILGDSVSKVLSPILVTLTGTLTGLVDKFDKLPSAAKTAVIAFAAIFAAVGPVLLITGQLFKLYTSLHSLLPILGAVMKTFATRIGGLSVATRLLRLAVSNLMVSTGIGALLVILGLLTTAVMSNEDAMATLKKAFNDVMEALKPLFDVLSESFTLIMDALKPAFDAFADVVADLAKVFSEKLADVVEKFVEKTLPPLIEFIEDATEGFIDFIDAVKGVLGPLLSADKAILGFIDKLGPLKGMLKNAAINLIPGASTIKNFFGMFSGGADEAADSVEVLGEKVKGLTNETDGLVDAVDEVIVSLEDMEAANAAAYSQMESDSEDRIKELKKEYGLAEKLE